MAKQRKALDVNQVFAYRLRDARLSKQWDQGQLAVEMKRLGFPSITRATISKIEAGRHGAGGEYDKPIRRGQTRPRPVSLAEAVAFAVALGVSPVSLFVPLTKADDVQLTPTVRHDVQSTYAWIRGDRPLNPDDPDAVAFYRSQGHERIFARPATIEDFERWGVPVRFEPSTTTEQEEQ